MVWADVQEESRPGVAATEHSAGFGRRYDVAVTEFNLQLCECHLKMFGVIFLSEF